MPVPKVLRQLVFEYPRLVSSKFCTEMIRRGHEIGFSNASIMSELGTQVMPDIRNNERVILDDPKLAHVLWSTIKPIFPKTFKGFQAVGLNERFRIYRYLPGHFFDWHQDGEYSKTDTIVSKFTVLIYLSDDFEGGGTSFADVYSPYSFQDFEIEPSIGKALFFHHPISHKGNEVVRGEKYVLRTDVMFSPSS